MSIILVARVIVIVNFLFLQCIWDILLNQVSSDLILQTNYDPEICGNFEQANCIVYDSHGVAYCSVYSGPVLKMTRVLFSLTAITATLVWTLVSTIQPTVIMQWTINTL